jgi:hypothetical protein
MVRLRLDPGLHGRLDTSDVVQEADLEASRKPADDVLKPALPFHLSPSPRCMNPPLPAFFIDPPPRPR